MSTESCEFTKLNLGIRGEYKLVKVNGSVPKVEDYFLLLRKPEDQGDNIPTWLYFGVKVELLKGYIVKNSKDAEGDLYEFSFVKIAYGDSGPLLTSIKNLKRVKFSDNFDEVNIISTDPNSTLLFKRFVQERPPYETSELLA